MVNTLYFVFQCTHIYAYKTKQNFTKESLLYAMHYDIFSSPPVYSLLFQLKKKIVGYDSPY